MKKLSAANQRQAERFIAIYARPLDRELHACYRGERTTADLLTALAAYQNGDGGFGHGLEPDFQMPHSSAMATSVALQYCLATAAPAAHPLVRRAVDYLCQTIAEDDGYWISTPPAVRDYAHAPWWPQHDSGRPDEAIWPNPSAELAGYLHHYAELVPSPLLDRVSSRAAQNLAAGGPITSIYNLLCWQRAAAVWPGPLRTAITDKLRDSFAALAPITAAALAEVSIFTLAPGPHSLFAREYPTVTAELLDAEIERQAADGGWWPTWAWGQFESEWPAAQRAWAGKMTVEALHILALFQRLA